MAQTTTLAGLNGNRLAPEAGKQVFTTGEAARLCNLSQQTIIRCFDDGRIRGFRVPGSKARRIPREDLIRFMRAHKMPLDALGLNAITLLVMDHESDTLDLIKQAADNLGDMAVHVAATAYDAGVLTAKIEPHVTILNARLPDIDIVSACRTLRKANGLPSSEVIVIATKFRQGEMESLKEANVRFFLRKPIAISELTRMLQRATAG
ncbi:MAG: helix-turn-helix domain-containing protein [Planctomycetes bacterium]|nr:helix-turn-helix domain-containing protein [Planctomycetota bacterium]